MTDWNATAVRDLILEAGRIALHHFEDPETEHKADNSLVTQADRDVEAYLRSHLEDLDRRVLFLGEESVGANGPGFVKKALSNVTWIVDPIDGTAPYANGLPTWGVSIGYMVSGRIEHGAILIPRSGELFITEGDSVLYQQGSRNADSWRFDDLKPLALPDRGYDTRGMVSLPQEIKSIGRFTGRNPIQSNGSAVYSAAKLMGGSYLAYLARVRLWDFAAAMAMFPRLGIRAVLRNGRELSRHVTEADWIMDTASPRCWKSTDLIVVARSAETVEYMRSHYEVHRDNH